MDASKVLATLFEENYVKLSTGEKVNIKKATLRTLQPTLQFLAKMLADMKLDSGNNPTLDLSDTALILNLISKYYDDVLVLVTAHSEVDTEVFVDMSLDDSILIVQGVVALNKDFFMKRVLPAMKMMTQNPQSVEPSETLPAVEPTQTVN